MATYDRLRTAKSKYHAQKTEATRYRNIDFNLTFNEWYDWWLQQGVDKNISHNISQNANDPCMCRYNDIGPYELGNIYCDTRSNNSTVGGKRIQTPDGIFVSRNAAARYYGITPSSMNSRIKRRPTEYFYV